MTEIFCANKGGCQTGFLKMKRLSPLRIEEGPIRNGQFVIPLVYCTIKQCRAFKVIRNCWGVSCVPRCHRVDFSLNRCFLCCSNHARNLIREGQRWTKVTTLLLAEDVHVVGDRLHTHRPTDQAIEVSNMWGQLDWEKTHKG